MSRTPRVSSAVVIRTAHCTRWSKDLPLRKNRNSWHVAAFYTGKGRIARIISAAAAKDLTPLTWELRGKSPVTIDPSFDIALAAKHTLGSKTQNCGQVSLEPFCLTWPLLLIILAVSPDYVLIRHTHQDAFRMLECGRTTLMVWTTFLFISECCL